MAVVGKTSWMKAFGGRGNAVGLTLLSCAESVAVADVGNRIAHESSLLVVCISFDDALQGASVHSAIGERISDSGVVELRSPLLGNKLGISLNGGAFVTPVELCSQGVVAVQVEVYSLSPTWSESAETDTCITVIFRLFSRGAEPEVPKRRPVVGHGLSGRCDHLGVSFVSPERVDDMLRHQGLASVHDLIDLAGTNDVGNRLVSDGALIPVWGMRPWVYRVVFAGAEGAFLPIGRRVSRVRRFSLGYSATSLTVAPGSALRDWNGFSEAGWPELAFPYGVNSIDVSIYSAMGFEPISPGLEVGVLPTVVVRPSSSDGVSSFDVDECGLFEQVDPFEWVGGPDEYLV